jgi:hypothetical protein
MTTDPTNTEISITTTATAASVFHANVVFVIFREHVLRTATATYTPYRAYTITKITNARVTVMNTEFT